MNDSGLIVEPFQLMSHFTVLAGHESPRRELAEGGHANVTWLAWGDIRQGIQPKRAPTRSTVSTETACLPRAGRAVEQFHEVRLSLNHRVDQRTNAVDGDLDDVPMLQREVIFGNDSRAGHQEDAHGKTVVSAQVAH